MQLDEKFVRDQFPALRDDFALFDNAGGSVACVDVIDRIGNFMRNYGVQIGASYIYSEQTYEALLDSRKELAKWINAPRFEEVIIGGSSTALLQMLSKVLAKGWNPGDEIIITDGEHEANVGCWNRLKEEGIVVKEWALNPESMQFELDDLTPLLSDKTKMVAMTHTSNIFGAVNPVRKIADFLHERGVQLCVDGVAYAPHRKVDVQALGADFYVFSVYKVYGPHQAILWGNYDQLLTMDGINHEFLEADAIPYKFLPGNFNFELTYGCAGVCKYLDRLSQHHNGVEPYALIEEKEAQLGGKLLDYLESRSDIEIIRPSQERLDYVPTIAFTHATLKSPYIVSEMDSKGVGIRHGDFYSKKIAANLDLQKHGGVVRSSMVHYNTEAEVDRLIAGFEEVMK